LNSRSHTFRYSSSSFVSACDGSKPGCNLVGLSRYRPTSLSRLGKYYVRVIHGFQDTIACSQRRAARVAHVKLA
jgi:hypothetical protein